MARNRILLCIRDFYLQSSDFNGILISDLVNELGCSWATLRKQLVSLICKQQITLAVASHSENPHIKRIADLSIEGQVAKLKTEPPETVCAYPTAAVIWQAVDVSAYNDRPFTQRLLLGEPHLTPVFFDLDVLDKYYRDPRYHFDFQDYEGSIGITTEHYESGDVREKDKVLLESFGIGYDKSRHYRVVVAYLRYLSRLSPEHQQIWNAHTLDEPCAMNSDYERATIWGHWPQHYSVYQAFCYEQVELNKLATLIGKPPLFRRTFEENRPEGFTPMLRPTRKNFNEFVQVLDKILSENINPAFFENDLSLEKKVTRPDGSVELQRIGTLQALETWLSQRYKTQDGTDVAREVLDPLREVRKLRQKPAHVLEEDEYDRNYPKTQDELLGRVCCALTSLRLIFSSHPKARNYQPPEWLDGDRIVFY